MAFNERESLGEPIEVRQYPRVKDPGSDQEVLYLFELALDLTVVEVIRSDAIGESHTFDDLLPLLPVGSREKAICSARFCRIGSL